MADIFASLEHWVDTRGVAGQTAYTGVTWNGGIWESWFDALRSGRALSGNAPWGASTGWIWGNVATGVRAPGTGQLTTYPTNQGLTYSSNYMVTTASIYGNRLLAKSPTAIDSVEGGVVVSMNGKTYRTSYGQRRLWQIDLLLNGPLDTLVNSYYPDMRARWPQFLRLAELGCTLYMHRTSWTYSGNLNTVANPFYGQPYKICGQLVDATNLRWTSQSSRAARWEVSITIAEQTAPGAVA